jgi:hypothetical protein
MMRALTLWRPWAWAIVAGHKPVENRPWPPPRNMVAVPFAIHAGKRWDDEGARAILNLVGTDDFPDDDPLVKAVGAIIGVATVDRVVRSTASPDLDPSHPGTLTDYERLWFFGPYGWVLRDVVRLREAVPCRGHQLFWTLPAAVEAEVHRQIGEVRR